MLISRPRGTCLIATAAYRSVPEVEDEAVEVGGLPGGSDEARRRVGGQAEGRLRRRRSSRRGGGRGPHTIKVLLFRVEAEAV